MISKINFTGREDMLGKGIRAGIQQIERHEYTNPAKVYTKEELQEALKKIDEAKMPKYESAEYTSPYAPIGKSAVAEADFVADSMPHGVNVDIKA